MSSTWTTSLSRQWSRLQIDRTLLVSMLRNALPPTAALWVIESSTLGKSFDVVGYLPIILCILQQPIQPRVQFLKSLLMTSLLSCLAACIALLAGFCSTKARLHTTPRGQSLDGYNSSAAVVSGIWLMFAVWAIQTFRVYRPQYTTSCVIATIMAIVSIVVGANLHTTIETTNFVAEMLQMWFLALSFSTAVNLLVWPTTSRGLVFTDIKQYIWLIRHVLAAEASFIQDLDHEYALGVDRHTAGSEPEKELDVELMANTVHVAATASPHAQAQKLIHLTADMSRLHAKLRGDLALAKLDIGWSNIDGHDLEIFVEHFHRIILSLRGMSVLMPAFQALCEGNHQQTLFGHEGSAEIDTWRAIFSDLKQPTDDVVDLMQAGLRHVEISLGFDQDETSFPSTVLRSRRRDVEAIDADHKPRPGSVDFVQHFQELVTTFHSRRGTNLHKWMERNDSSSSTQRHATTSTDHNLDSSQKQLLVILFMQHLFHHISDVVLDLVTFADSKKTGQAKRLIIPRSQRLASLVQTLVGQDDSHEDFDYGVPQLTTTGAEAYARAATTTTTSTKQSRIGAITSLRLLGSLMARTSRVVGSHQSFFGFRVACAVMSIVVVALLAETQQWFYNHRALWAAVFIPFSMSPNSGETLSLLLFRMIGSTWALGLSLVNWYIVDGHPAGVIVFYFVFTFIENYFVIRFPQYGSIWRPALITRAIITGYTLQTQHSHMAAPPATSVGQYPIYLIGPYRYVCTAIGVFVAFVWTVFPRAVSARSLARSKLGDALSLLALYYNCMHSTVGVWATRSRDHVVDQDGLLQLHDMRDTLFAQELVALGAIRGHMRFSRFEPSMGGSFARDRFAAITDEIDTIVSYMNMVVYATGSLGPSLVASHAHSHASPWHQRFARAFRSADFSTHSISVLLSVLSVAVTNNQPLPPGLSAPSPYRLVRHIQQLDPDMLSTAHAEEAGYAAFAVIELGSSMMYESLGRLLQHVKDLVGVLDYFPIDKDMWGKQV